MYACSTIEQRQKQKKKKKKPSPTLSSHKSVDLFSVLVLASSRTFDECLECFLKTIAIADGFIFIIIIISVNSVSSLIRYNSGQMLSEAQMTVTAAIVSSFVVTQKHTHTHTHSYICDMKSCLSQRISLFR